jgi:hypothetical protein
VRVEGEIPEAIRVRHSTLKVKFAMSPQPFVVCALALSGVNSKDKIVSIAILTPW